jgi:hypothetical protein
VPMLAVGGGGGILAIRESHPKSTPGTLTQANIDISLIELIL